MADASQSSSGGRVLPQVPEALQHQLRSRSPPHPSSYRTVDNAVTDNGIPITPLLDEKVISKLVREYKKFSSDTGAFEPSKPEHANNIEVSAKRSQAVSYVLPSNTSTFSPSVAHITNNSIISGTGDSKAIHDIVSKIPQGTSTTLDTATTHRVNATAATVPYTLFVPFSLLHHFHRLKADNLGPTMQPLRPRPSSLSLLRLPFQHLQLSRSQQMSLSQLLPTPTYISTHYTSTSTSPRPETIQEHIIPAVPTTPTYPITQSFTTPAQQRPQTPQERVITARLQQARVQYKSNVAELKRAKRGKRRGKGKRVTLVESGYGGLTEFSG